MTQHGRSAHLLWFFAEQQGLCYLGLTGKCARRANLMILRKLPSRYKYADDLDPFVGGCATWEHVMPRPMRLVGHTSLLLVACADCNNAKGCAAPEPEHVERALELGLRWIDSPECTAEQTHRARIRLELQASYDHYLRLRDSPVIAAVIERKGKRATWPAVEYPPPATVAEALAQGGLVAPDLARTKTQKRREQRQAAVDRSKHPNIPLGTARAAMLATLPRAERAAALGVTDPRFLPDPVAGAGEHASEGRALKNAKTQAAALRHIADQHRKKGDTNQADAISAKAWAILDAVKRDKPKGRGP